MTETKWCMICECRVEHGHACKKSMIEPDTTETVAKKLKEFYFDKAARFSSILPDTAPLAMAAIKADREELAKQGYVICKKVAIKQNPEIIWTSAEIAHSFKEAEDLAFATGYKTAIRELINLGLPIEIIE